MARADRRELSGAGLHGLLLVDKPGGPTSHDVVNRVRRASGTRRVGHAGTLDPLASGLLPLVLGRATRLVRFLPDGPKTYTGRLLLGRSTTTDDVTGPTLRLHESALPPTAEVLAAARRLVGRQLQTPPVFSARRVEGRRLYDLARKGIEVEAPPAEIEVTRFDLVPVDEPGAYDFTAEVSAGTYIRGLVRDLGLALGCGGVLAALVRTRIGPLRLDDATRWPDDASDTTWVARSLIAVEAMPLVPPRVRLLDVDDARRFVLGNAVRAPEGAGLGPVCVLHPEGPLLGIGEARPPEIRPRVVVAPRPED